MRRATTPGYGDDTDAGAERQQHKPGHRQVTQAGRLAERFGERCCRAMAERELAAGRIGLFDRWATAADLAAGKAVGA